MLSEKFLLLREEVFEFNLKKRASRITKPPVVLFVFLSTIGFAISV